MIYCAILYMFSLLKKSIVYYLKRKCEIFQLYHLVNHGNTGHFRKLFPLFFVINFLFHYILLHQNCICQMCILYESIFIIIFILYFNNFYIQNVFYLTINIIYTYTSFLTLSIKNQHSIFNIFPDFIYHKLYFFHESIAKTKFGNIFRTQASP